MKRLPLRPIVVTTVAALLILFTGVARSVEARGPRSNDKPVVRAVLFFSPTCGHCEYVITELLVPMVNDYGDQLQIVGIDTSQMGGAQLFQAAIERYQVPSERRGVPMLVVGNVVLVGSLEIPEQFPDLVDQGLATGGIDWPDLPGLAEMLSEAQAEPTSTAVPSATGTAISITATVSPAMGTPLPSSTAVPHTTATPVPSSTAAPDPSILSVGEDDIPSHGVQEPDPDPLGFSLAGGVLVGMAVAFSYAARRTWLARQRLFDYAGNPGVRARGPAVPILVLLGLCVATYLAYVEVNQVKAVCGPVGECNIVQASAYAVMLGIPVAVWGALNYVTVGVLWAGQRYLPGWRAHLSALALSGLTLFGTLFSIYLTCLELFVIRAICAWCLSSAVITTVVMLLVTVPVTGGRLPERTSAFGRKA